VLYHYEFLNDMDSVGTFIEAYSWQEKKIETQGDNPPAQPGVDEPAQD